MSSILRPYIIDDDDSDGGVGFYDVDDEDADFLDYDSDDCSEPEIISVRDCTPTSVPSRPSRSGAAREKQSITLPDIRLGVGSLVKPGDTLELKDQYTRSSNTMHSGDFLHVTNIIQNLETDKIRFQGHRMRRTKYLHQTFDWKLNELCMVLYVQEGDNRCPFVAGLEDVDEDDVLHVRECTLTSKPYPDLSFRQDGLCAYPANMSKAEILRQVYHGGRLTCRVVSILFLHEKVKNTKTTQKPRSGIVRHLYAHETRTPGRDTRRTPTAGSSRETSITIEDNSEDEVIIVSSRKRRARSDSIEIIEESQQKRALLHPVKKHRYTFGDVFCGIGGASYGALQAGLQVVWGLDANQPALHAYQKNHRGATAFLCNAHDFPPRGRTGEHLWVDVVHLSPPCCYFSPAHTVEGQNDQANYEAIYTVGPILKKVQPRVATLEQTFGLSHRQHIKFFYMLLNDIGKAGYDIQYKVQDLSKHGLGQRRKRLLIIAARRGIPLPPFPKESHGPEGSGLKSFVTVHDALGPLERMGRRASFNDAYHQPTPARIPREPTNPHDLLRGCITTKGSDSYHYSGLRKWTVRELSLLQSFPYGYKFSGSKTEATKQLGNAFPPVMAEAMYRSIVKTLDAFDSGLISAEDDLSDLDAVLLEKGAHSQPTLAFRQPRST